MLGTRLHLDPVLHCGRPVLTGKSKASFSARAFLKEGPRPGRGPHGFFGRRPHSIGWEAGKKEALSEFPGTAEKMRRPCPQCPRSWDPGGGGGVFWDELPRLQRSPGAGGQQEARRALASDAVFGVGARGIVLGRSWHPGRPRACAASCVGPFHSYGRHPACKAAPDGEGRGAPGSVLCVLGDAGRAPAPFS